MSTDQDLKIIRYGTQDGHQPTAQPMESSVSLYVGQIAITRGGYLIQPDDNVDATDICWGLINGIVASAPAVESPIENTSSIAGANGLIGIDTGTFFLTNGTSSDELTQADVGAACYALDGNTAAKTDGGAARPVLGRLAALGTGQYDGMVAVTIGNDQSSGSP